MKYPLLDYAANYWNHHVRLAQYSDSPGQHKLEDKGGDIFQYTLGFLNDYRLGYECATQARKFAESIDWEEVCGPTPLLSSVVITGISSLVPQLLDDPRTDRFAQDYLGYLPLHIATSLSPLTDHPQERSQIVDMLLEAGADIDCVGAVTGSTPLHMACSFALPDVVRSLLQRGANPSILNKEKRTPMNQAHALKSYTVVEELLKAGADSTTPDASGFAPIINAAWYGHWDVVRLLLKFGVDPTTAATPDGYSLLHVAASKGAIAEIDMLLDAGVDVDLASKDGWTPLLTAATSGMHDSVEKLLSLGANINVLVGGSQGEDTPLSTACRKGYLEVVKVLIERGADVNQVQTDKDTGALHVATLEGHKEIVEYLLSQGASVDLPGWYGMTPFMLGAAFGGNIEICKILLRHGAQVDNNVLEVGTFDLTCLRGQTDVVRWMLDNGMDTAVTIDYMIRSKKRDGHPAIAEMLMDSGLGPNEPGRDREAPIFACIEHDRFDILEVLVKRGADLNIVDKEGNVPLTAAATAGKVDMVAFLLGHGADLKSCQADLVATLAATSRDGDVLEQFTKRGLGDMITEISVTGSGEK